MKHRGIARLIFFVSSSPRRAAMMRRPGNGRLWPNSRGINCRDFIVSAFPAAPLPNFSMPLSSVDFTSRTSERAVNFIEPDERDERDERATRQTEIIVCRL